MTKNRQCVKNEKTTRFVYQISFFSVAVILLNFFFIGISPQFCSNYQRCLMFLSDRRLQFCTLLLSQPEFEYDAFGRSGVAMRCTREATVLEFSTQGGYIRSGSMIRLELRSQDNIFSYSFALLFSGQQRNKE